MNKLMVRNIVRITCCLALLAAWLLPASAATDDQYGGIEPRRLLLIFETSKVMKENLPLIKATLARLFSSNLQNQLYPYDDIAVWTVDDTVHAEQSLIYSWEPDEAATYTGKVCEFLLKQKFSRHTSLEPIQPALNRIVKHSEHLTVLIFCDSQSRMVGTPYDTGINSIITNTATRLEGKQTPLIIVLRSYRGQYIGSSVNASAQLNFPKFPTPPKPAPPVALSETTPVPVPHAGEKPAATVPDMIIVGTEAGTNVSLLTNTPPPAARPATMVPATTPTLTNAAAPAAPAPAPMQVAVTQFQPAPPPVTESKPVAQPVPPPQSAPPPTVAASEPPSPIPQAQPIVRQTNSVVATAAGTPPNKGYLVPLAAGLGALGAALAIVIGLVIRGSRPRSSLITSSMYDDHRQPPPPK